MAAPKALSANVNLKRVNATINAVEKDLITTIKQKQEYVLTEFFTGKDIFTVFLTGCGKAWFINSTGDEEDVPWHKSNLYSCFTTCCTTGGSDTRGFKTGDHSHADRCSQRFRCTTRMLPPGIQQSLKVSTLAQLLPTVIIFSSLKSRLIHTVALDRNVELTRSGWF